MGSQVSRAAFQPPFPPPEIPSPATTTEYGRLRVEELGVTVARVLCRGSENVDAQQSASGTLSRRRQILLFSHGNAEDVASIGPWMEIVAEELHVDVFAYDYPGYGAPDEGRSALEPSEAGAFACARAAYRHLRDGMKIDPRDIVLFGRSLGTGMTVELASSYAASGVILQSPLRSAIRVVQNTPFSLPFDIMVNQEKLPKVRCPVFILHGEEDEVISVDHGKHLHQLATRHGCAWEDGAWWIPSCGHNDIETLVQDEYFSKLRAFLQHVETRDDAPTPGKPAKSLAASSLFSSSQGASASSLSGPNSY